MDEFAGWVPDGTFESFRTDLGLTYTQASAVLVAGAPGAIFGNVFAVLADYRSRRVIATSGAFGFAASLAVFGLASEFAVLLFASFTLGCASSALCDGTEVALIDLAEDEAPAQISRAFLLGAIGDVLGPVLLIVVAASGFSWRVAFSVAAVTVAAYGLWLATFRFPPPRPHLDHSPRDGLRLIVRDPRVWYFGVLALLLGPLDEDALAFLIAYLERDHGLSVAAANAVAAASVVGALIGFVSTSRHGYRPPARAMRNQMAVIAASLFAAVLVANVWVIVAAEFVFGFAVARYWIALKTRIVQLYPDRVGSVNAVVSTIEYSAFLLPVFAGYLADTFGVRAGFGISAIVAVVT
ncbi:MAG: MFS transporter, partial [Acidimicrobiia bacterium]